VGPEVSLPRPFHPSRQSFVGVSPSSLAPWPDERPRWQDGRARNRFHPARWSVPVGGVKTRELAVPCKEAVRVSNVFLASRDERGHPELCCRACSAAHSGPNPSCFVLDSRPGLLPNCCQAGGWRNTPKRNLSRHQQRNVT